MTTLSTPLHHKVEPEMDVATTTYIRGSHYKNTGTTINEIVLQPGKTWISQQDSHGN